MKRKQIVAFAASVCVLALFALIAQETVDHTTAVRTAPFRVSETEPGTCEPWDFYVNSTTEKLRYCNSSKAWADSEIAAGALVWGGITGTLSDQTDLDSALAAKQTVANLDTTATLGTSDTKYPSQKAVKSYVDGQFTNAVTASGTACTITAITNGVITGATCTP